MNRKAGSTEELIRDTYIALMKKKNCMKISVRELAENAHIQRSTFYRDYDNINHLITSLEKELLEEMVFYIPPSDFDIRHIKPLKSIEAWFQWGMENRNTLTALMGENGDPYFGEKFKEKVCGDINRMMDFEGMPRDELRLFCVELTYSIHFSLLKFAMQLGKERCPFTAKELTRLSNYWRVCALKAEQEKKFPVSMAEKRKEGGIVNGKTGLSDAHDQ